MDAYIWWALIRWKTMHKCQAHSRARSPLNDATSHWAHSNVNKLEQQVAETMPTYHVKNCTSKKTRNVLTVKL